MRAVTALRGAAALAVGAAVSMAIVASPAQAAGSSLLSESQLRKALLTTSQAQRAVPMSSTLASDGVHCQASPYGTGTVRYCFYSYLHSDGAASAGTLWPNHVDIISLESSAAARKYIKELSTTGPKRTTVQATRTTLVVHDADGLLQVPVPGASDPQSVSGPMASVYEARGATVVYTACADPHATSPSALVTCAKHLAAAQWKKLAATK